jgi:hypothetical protein
MAINWEAVPNEKFPKVEDQIVLGYDKTRNLAWLEFKNTSFLVDRSYRPGVFKTVIGAVQSGNKWEPITIAQASGEGKLSLANAFTDATRAFDFQKAVVEQWQKFSSARASDFAKGTTFGKSLTSPSFVAKALKTGFDAIGEPAAAYSGIKLSDWTVNDLLNYTRKRAPGLLDASLIGFEPFAPDPAHARSMGEPPRDTDRREIDYIPSVRAAGHSHHFAYASELEALNGIIPFERVIGYGFRGDSRSPGDIKGAGGFLPNYTRTDHIARLDEKLAQGLKEYFTLRNDLKHYDVLKSWVEKEGGEWNLTRIVRNPKFREFVNRDFINGLFQAGRNAAQCPRLSEWLELQGGALNLAEFIQQQDFRGFISTSKSIGIAKNFATGAGRPGWVYACFVEGAFHFPLSGEHPWLKFDEMELCMPGMLDWDDIVACRRVSSAGAFEGPVWIKQAIIQSDLDAAWKIYQLLSNKLQ